MSVDLDDEAVAEPEERPEYDRDLLLELWERHRKTHGGAHSARSSFPAVVAASFADDISDEIVWCESCEDPGVNGEDDFTQVKDGGFVCEPCLNDGYFYCETCEEYDATSDSHYDDNSGDYVCEGCYERYYSYCDECDESYHNDYAEDHEHDNDCDCEAPAQAFTVRNDGEPPLANDTRATIALPAGEIDQQGIRRIVRLLQQESRYTAAQIVWDGNIGSAWQTREGNFTKRLSRANHKVGAKALSPEVMSAIGTIARDHSKPVEVAVEVTRALNGSDDEFGNSGSCWWSSHSESRCALKSNGGFGLRSWTADAGPYSYAEGRAWVMPLKMTANGTLVPTFNTIDPDAFVVFNGYGDLSGYTPARIVAHMAGMTYRKITFDVDPMYVNSTAGYLVAPEAIATQYTDGSLYLSVDQHSRLHHIESTEGVTSRVA